MPGTALGTRDSGSGRQCPRFLKLWFQTGGRGRGWGAFSVLGLPSRQLSGSQPGEKERAAPVESEQPSASGRFSWKLLRELPQSRASFSSRASATGEPLPGEGRHGVSRKSVCLSGVPNKHRKFAVPRNAQSAWKVLPFAWIAPDRYWPPSKTPCWGQGRESRTRSPVCCRSHSGPNVSRTVSLPQPDDGPPAPFGVREGGIALSCSEPLGFRKASGAPDVSPSLS